MYNNIPNFPAKIKRLELVNDKTKDVIVSCLNCKTIELLEAVQSKGKNI